MDDDTIYKQAVEFFGAESQVKKTIEELGELIVALIHYSDDRISLKQLAQEIADVEIMCEQMRQIVGVSIVESQKAIKLKRLSEKLRRKQ